MAITTGGNAGTAGIGVSSTSLALTTTSLISAAQFAILGVSTDNSTTADGASNNHVSITGGTGTWTKLGEYTNGNGAAAAGVTVSQWLFVPSADNAIDTVFTVNFAAAVVDKTAGIWRFNYDNTKGLRQITEAAPVLNGVDAVAGFGSVAYSGLPATARLYVRAMGKEANTTTGITPTAGFTGMSNSRSRNNTLAVIQRGEFKIATSTGETSNPTLAVVGDTAGVFNAIEEFAAEAGPITGVGAAIAQALTLAAPLAASTGAMSVASITGTGAAIAQALTLAAPLASGTGAMSVASVTGTGAAVAQALTLAAPLAVAFGSAVTQGVTGVGAAVAPALVLSAPTAVGLGVYVIEGVTGVGAAVAPAITLPNPTAVAFGSAVTQGGGDREPEYQVIATLHPQPEIVATLPRQPEVVATLHPQPEIIATLKRKAA
ncbi:MAG: hypothetical protein Q8J79_14005 [Erythrobacter sp.]|nr:hypothetical protein [Erythrobacter sp.]